MKTNLNTYKRLLAMFTILVMGMGTLVASGTKDDYTNSYLTIESLTDNNTITLRIPPGVTSAELTSVSYSTDGTDWTALEIDSTLQTIIVGLNQGDKVYFKGLGRQYATYDAPSYCNFSGTDDFMVYGNIMSLLYGDDFASQTTLPAGSDNTFSALFMDNDHLVSAENLILPATALIERCYSYMFFNCPSLTKAPALPATTLADRCYMYMFIDCTSLATPPALPATDLEYGCYVGMFYGCASLMTAPELPATTLADWCYFRMFYDCSSLTTAPALPATDLADYCYYVMFYGCSSLTTPPALPATTMKYACYANLFENCYSLSEAPELPATDLAEFCYYNTFHCCTSLTIAPELPATDLADECYYGMFFGCSSLIEAPELPATSLKYACYEYMFEGCSSLIEAPELPATVLADRCYYRMFNSCSSLTETPELAAAVLADSCYVMMFNNCSSLAEVTCLATDISASGCTYEWLDSVAPCGTFYKAPEMYDWPLNSISGIPEGWSVTDWDKVDEQQEQLAFYPNPVKDMLHITSSGIQSVKVFDAQGHLIHSEECGHANQVKLDFQGLAKGIYTVSVQSEGGDVIRKVVF